MKNKRLYIFDMDGTLLPNTTALIEIAKITGHVNELNELENRYTRQEIHPEEFAETVYQLWGVPSAEIVKKAFIQSPKLQNIKNVVDLIHNKGHATCLITGSQNIFANHFFDYGFQHIFASHTFDGGYNKTNVLHPHDKPRIARELCEKLELTFYDCVAFGDSVSDMPLFQDLSHTVAVNGNEKIKKLAKHHYQGDDLLAAFSLVSEF